MTIKAFPQNRDFSLSELNKIIKNILNKINKQEKFRRAEINALLNDQTYNSDFLLLYTKTQLSFSSHLIRIYNVLINKINNDVTKLKHSNNKNNLIYLNNLLDEALITKSYLNKAIVLLKEEIDNILNKNYYNLRKLFNNEDKLTTDLKRDIKNRNLSIYKLLLQKLTSRISILFDFILKKNKSVSIIFVIVMLLSVTSEAYSQTIKTITLKESEKTTKNEDSKNFLNVKSNIALLIIDMQESYLNSIDKGVRDSLINTQIHLIDYANLNHIPIVIFEMKGKGKTISLLKEHINDGIHKYYSKDDANGFNLISVYFDFNRIGIKNIIVTGINASRCFTETILGFYFKFIYHVDKESINQYHILTSPYFTADPDWKSQNWPNNKIKEKVKIFTLENLIMINNIKELDNYLLNMYND